MSKLAPQLPIGVRRRMSVFAKEELIVRSPAGHQPSWQWIRALSTKDALAKENITKRPDHGVTGSYAAWPAMVAEGLAALDGAWDDAANGALALLRGAAAVTLEGPLGQAHELRQPCDGDDVRPGPTNAPRVSDERSRMRALECAHAPPFKSFREFTRYVADNGGAFVDVIIRSLFGFTPRWNA